MTRFLSLLLLALLVTTAAPWVSVRAAEPGCKPPAKGHPLESDEQETRNLLKAVRDTIPQSADGVFYVNPPAQDFPKLHATAATLAYDRANKIRYYTKEEAEQFRVHFGEDGKIYDATGHLFDTSKGIPGSGKINKGKPCARYVMLVDGTFMMEVGHPDTSFKHTSFRAGKSVAAAGEIEVHDGVPVYINRASGHYAPSPEVLKRAAKWIEEITHRKLKVDTEYE